jgi:hypothetical protein
MAVKKVDSKTLYTLIPLEEFKSLLGIDDREDKLARFCLVTSTCTIEEYCKRRLLKKQYFEVVKCFRDLLFTLPEYPVISINSEKLTMNNGEMINPNLYRVIPDCGSNMNFPYSIEFSPAIKKLRCNAIKIVYQAGYVVKPHPCGFTTRSFCTAKTPAKALETAASMPPVPPDLSAACLELASWSMNRYKGRRVGMTGNVRGGGKDGEHFEMSMPENVKQLLEPHRRKVI